MSYGALSPRAVMALNRGAMLAGALQNTGEGGIADAHLQGGELIFQIGTGYFGCRDERGRFSLEQLRARVQQAPVRAIEIKLSQGAKPGLGGLLPAAKVTPEIAAVRGVPVGEDCVSPPMHSAFSDVDGLIEFVEMIAAETGLPVGIKSAVGEGGFWQRLAEQDGSHRRGAGLHRRSTAARAGPVRRRWRSPTTSRSPSSSGSRASTRRSPAPGLPRTCCSSAPGALGFPDAALFAFALGCDMVHVGREAMLSIGCIQAQRCHTGRCPAGVATQSRWLMHGLDPQLKSSHGSELSRRAPRRDPRARTLLRRAPPCARRALPHRDRHRALPLG